MDELVATTTRAFSERTGAAPDGVWSAPGRVNLIGEHLDYNGGHVLPFALSKSVAVGVRRRTDKEVRCWSTSQGTALFGSLEELTTAAGWTRYVAGTMWGLRNTGAVFSGVDIVVASRLPAGAGLASSAALGCAIALALDDLFELGLSTDELALAAQRGEIEFAGAPVGPMDHLASLHGVAEHALLVNCNDRSVTPVHLLPERAGYSLLVVDTKRRHDIASGAYAQKRSACAEAVRQLGIRMLSAAEPDDPARVTPELRGIVRHVVSEERRVGRAVQLLRAERFAEVGQLMNASHASLRYDFGVSCPELDAVVAAAQRTGAVGARLTGGGFGGSVIILAPSNSVRTISDAVTQGLAPFGIEPTIDPVSASAGARRIF